MKEINWNKYYTDSKYNLINYDNELTKWLFHICPITEGNVFEIGCFPGYYLETFSRMGFTVNGIDKYPETEKILIKRFIHNKIKFNDIIVGDLFSHETVNKYDLVCSFGLIEHFENWNEILEIHLKYLKKGGILIIVVPNFRGYIQRLLHWIFDNDNYTKHNIKAMNYKEWEIQLKNKIEITYFVGPFGKFDFWTENNSSNIIYKIFIKMIYLLSKYFGKKVGSSKIYSPYYGFVCKIK